MAWIMRPGGRPTEISDAAPDCLRQHAQATVAADGNSPIIDEVVAALERSMIALDDWLHVYADDMCDMASVAESERRIGQLGTIGYIADVQAQNRAAINAIKGTDHD